MYFLQLVSIAAFAGTVWAQSTPSTAPPQLFKLGIPTYKGSGCPNNSVSIVQSTAGDKVSVLFSEYEAITSEEILRVRKSCSLAVPVDIQPGFQIAMFEVDYRGYAYVPEENNKRGYAEFKAEYFFAGARGPRVRRKYRAGYDDDVEISNKLIGAAWSPCGSSEIFRINTAITAKREQGAEEEVEMTLDTVDTSSKRVFYYKFKSRACP